MGLTLHFHDLFALFFPKTCAGCDKPLAYNEQLICTACWFHMPYTNGHLDPNNESAKRLWGRIPLEAVASFLYFRDASRVRRIMHQLKYGRQPEIGILLGLRYGELLRKAIPFNQVDVIVPVPLHPVKQRERGYNQSAFFAHGLSTSLRKPVILNAVVKSKLKESQTHKSRYNRYENMQGTFEMHCCDPINGKHVLLVDDVLTTGATVEVCASVLLEGGAHKVSVATIAKAT